MTYPSPGGNPDPHQPGGAPDPYQQPTGGDPYQPYAQPDPKQGYHQDPGYAAAGYPAPGYPAPGYQAPGYAAPGTNIMAILSLVFAFVFAPVGIVLGHIAKKQIRQTGEQGEGLAMAGLVLSYILTGLSVLACCGAIGLGILGASTSGTDGY